MHSRQLDSTINYFDYLTIAYVLVLVFSIGLIFYVLTHPSGPIITYLNGYHGKSTQLVDWTRKINQVLLKSKSRTKNKIH